MTAFFLDQYIFFFCNLVMVQIEWSLLLMINSISSLGGGVMGTL